MHMLDHTQNHAYRHLRCAKLVPDISPRSMLRSYLFVVGGICFVVKVLIIWDPGNETVSSGIDGWVVCGENMFRNDSLQRHVLAQLSHSRTRYCIACTPRERFALCSVLCRQPVELQGMNNCDPPKMCWPSDICSLIHAVKWSADAYVCAATQPWLSQACEQGAGE